MLDAWLDLTAGSACVHCRRPGRLLCADCSALLPERGAATSPDPCPPGLAASVVGGPYADVLRAMVLAHKERRAFALAGPLGRVLAVAVRELAADGCCSWCRCRRDRSWWPPAGTTRCCG